MKTIAIAALAGATLLAGCNEYGSGPAYASDPYGYSQYDYNHPDPSYGGYDAGRYYREGRNYRERRLSANDRVYRGNDGRYYCRRNDGTTGLVVGGIAGGAAGAAIAPGGSSLLGALIGGVAGAVGGKAIDKGTNHTICK